jgi:glycosyltransferase involved in cell wall biosynthesis
VQNKVLEALAAGLPVVTTPAVAEGLPDAALAGCIVAQDDQESASALLSLLRRSPTERRAFSKAADLSELGWTRQLAALVPILTAAAQRKPFIRLAS